MDSTLPLSIKVGYGLGHILNDLCASMWFTYLLLFFHQVLYFNNTYAGVILLIGQVADGVSTTVVGAFCDGKSQDGPWLCRRYGQRKSWHLVGTVCVLASFPFLWMACLGCSDSDELAQLVYYASFAVVFQFGWASVQISHLALIPGLTNCQNERTGLTAIRYGMTVISNMAVYVVAWVVFGQAGGQTVGPHDEDKFRTIMLAVLGIGACASVGFHLTVSEIDSQVTSGYEEINGDTTSAETKPRPMAMKDWFKEPQFYQVAGVYMSTRLFVNLSQAYIPLYLQESLELESTYVAIIPLVMYSSSFVASFGIKFLNRKAGRKVSYLLGSVVGMAAAVWVYWGDTLQYQWFKHTGIFIAAALYGAAGCAVLVSSLAMTAELIGPDTESAAFVYGAMSFTDKVSNGCTVMLIQNLIPCLKCCPACKWYFRDVLFYATGGSALLGAVVLCSLAMTRVGERRRDRVQEVTPTEEEERRSLLGGGEGEGTVYT